MGRAEGMSAPHDGCQERPYLSSSRLWEHWQEMQHFSYQTSLHELCQLDILSAYHQWQAEDNQLSL